MRHYYVQEQAEDNALWMHEVMYSIRAVEPPRYML
jgi:hypothetical protein